MDSSNKGMTFPMEGLTTFSAYVFGLLGLLAGRVWFGLNWPTVLLLYFPCKNLARGIADNEMRKVVNSLLLILLFPAISSAMVKQLPQLVLSVDAIRSIEWAKTVIPILVVIVSFGVVRLVTDFISSVFESLRLPSGLHSASVRIEIIISCIAVFLSVILGFRVLEQFGCNISFSLRLLIMLLVWCGSVGCIWGVLRAPIGTPKTPSRRKSTLQQKHRADPTCAPVAVHEVKPPSVRFSDVAGMEEVKRQIRLRLIDPVQDAARARKYGINVGGGMLLYGPPGTGKTFIAKAVAGELGLPFFAITAADVFGRYVGDSEGNIRRIFNEVRKHPLSVVFIDELETLFPKRTEEVHETTRKVISLLLQELDGIEEAKNPILLLGATNVPWMIDEAFMRPGRFDVSVFVGLPDFAAREQMFVAAFAKGSVPYVSNLPTYLAERTESYSGADVKGLMTKLRQAAYERRVRVYKTDLVDEILAQTSPSANGDILAAIREWESKRSRK